jgi:uncharacterized metal-binding protein
MSSGKSHDNFNSGITLLCVASSTVMPSMLYVAAGVAIGTVWLSPDLDLKQSRPSSRLLFLKPFFAPYRTLCGHHRSIVSHSPILSTAIRVFYCLIPLTAYCFYVKDPTLILKLLLDTRFHGIYVGLELSTITHLTLDLQSSLRRRRW